MSKDDQIIRIGIPPKQIEIRTTISGVAFNECSPRREEVEWDSVQVPVIGLADLKNKQAIGRLKDLADLENL